MKNTMDSTECANGSSSALEDEIISTAYDVLHRGESLHLLLTINKKVVERGGEKELEPMLEQYGEILSNHNFTEAIRIKLSNLGKIKEIVRDYESGKLKDVEGIELSSMDAVMCGGY